MNNFDAFNKALQMEILRMQIVSLVVVIALFLIASWISYLVIKAAIRDGIK
jgi:multisubunit Na+/H+ antiporter MnhG subunit